MTTFDQLEHSFRHFLSSHFNIQEQDLPLIQFALTTDTVREQFGDITCNAPLVLAKKIGKKPLDIAQKILEWKHECVQSIEKAGPGFINITLTLDAFKKIAEDILELQNQYFKLDPSHPVYTYLIEFVSANPTGPLHIGHGRNGIIGDVLGTVLSFLGHRVIKEFYINDAGNQLKKLRDSFKARVHEVLGMTIQFPEDGYHGKYLKTLAEEAVSHFGPAILTQPDTFFEDYPKNALLAAIKKTLTDYGIQHEVWFSEQTLYETGAVEKALNRLHDRGYTYEKDGALWFQSTSFGDDKDRVLKKSNGEYTYMASDIAYLQNKKERADKLIIVLGQDHHGYVKRLHGALSALGYNPDDLSVILYQLVTIKQQGEEVRLSKRTGTIVSLQDIIDTVSADIARFFYLHRKAEAHLDFDIDLALQHTDENPVYYIQYAYIRSGSILQKAQELTEFQSLTSLDIAGLTPAETILLKKIISLKNILHTINHTHETHLLTYYALELAHVFHRYYNNNRVIDDSNIPQSRARLIIVQLTRTTLELCLNLLGISRPHYM